jgi:hypothetical protein
MSVPPARRIIGYLLSRQLSRQLSIHPPRSKSSGSGLLRRSAATRPPNTGKPGAAGCRFITTARHQATLYSVSDLALTCLAAFLGNGYSDIVVIIDVRETQSLGLQALVDLMPDLRFGLLTLTDRRHC